MRVGQLESDYCEMSFCDNIATRVSNCGCYPKDHGWTYKLCRECEEWMKGRITCPFHGDVTN